MCGFDLIILPKMFDTIRYCFNNKCSAAIDKFGMVKVSDDDISLEIIKIGEEDSVYTFARKVSEAIAKYDTLRSKKLYDYVMNYKIIEQDFSRGYSLLDYGVLLPPSARDHVNFTKIHVQNNEGLQEYAKRIFSQIK